MNELMSLRLHIATEVLGVTLDEECLFLCDIFTFDVHTQVEEHELGSQEYELGEN